MFRSLFVACVFGILLNPVFALSQILENSVEGSYSGELFGFSVLGNIDLNSDSVPDFMVGSPSSAPPGGPGKATVFSGSDLSIIATLTPVSGEDPNSFEFFGRRLATVGDLDSDGKTDIAVSAPGSFNTNLKGYVKLFSSADLTEIGSAIRATQNNTIFGWSVSGGGDATGDGIPDLIIGAPLDPNFQAGDGRAYIASGAGSHPTFAVERHQLSSFEFALAVIDIGDVNGDNKTDYIVSEAYYRGLLYIISGSTRQIINLVCIGGYTYPNCGGGATIYSGAKLGDVDGDGIADFVIGINSPIARVEIYSGATQSLIRTVYYQVSGDGFGTSVAQIGDQDSDGVNDLLVGAPGSEALGVKGYVKCISGSNGTILFTINSQSTTEGFGSAVASAGDVNGDGREDVIVGSPRYGTDLHGRIQIFTSPDTMSANLRGQYKKIGNAIVYF